jgi:hypothetical protein
MGIGSTFIEFTKCLVNEEFPDWNITLTVLDDELKSFYEKAGFQFDDDGNGKLTADAIARQLDVTNEEEFTI